MYLWQWFVELHATRPSGFGHGAITHQEITAWAALTGRHPVAWEIHAIRQIDMAYLESVNRDNRDQVSNHRR